MPTPVYICFHVWSLQLHMSALSVLVLILVYHYQRGGGGEVLMYRARLIKSCQEVSGRIMKYMLMLRVDKISET